MNNSPYSGKNKKGFYAALTLSLLAVIAAVVGVGITAKKVRLSVTEPTQTTIDWDNHSSHVSEEEANKFETGVKDERTTESIPETSEAESETTDESTTQAATTEKAEEYSLPMGTAILKDYSNGTMVKSKTMNDWRTHNGVDFTGETGDEIRAVGHGTVEDILVDASWGTVVVLKLDNGTKARYCGIDNINVEKGETVERDFVIGTLGVIPIESADVSHLHFEMLRDGKYIDPIEALSMQREED